MADEGEIDPTKDQVKQVVQIALTIRELEQQVQALLTERNRIDEGIEEKRGRIADLEGQVRRRLK